MNDKHYEFAKKAHAGVLMGSLVTQNESFCHRMTEDGWHRITVYTEEGAQCCEISRSVVNPAFVRIGT